MCTSFARHYGAGQHHTVPVEGGIHRISSNCRQRTQPRQPSGAVHAGGVDGLLLGESRPSRVPRLPEKVAERVVALTLTDRKQCDGATLFVSLRVARRLGLGVRLTIRALSRPKPTGFIRSRPPGRAITSLSSSQL